MFKEGDKVYVHHIGRCFGNPIWGSILLITWILLSHITTVNNMKKFVDYRLVAFVKSTIQGVSKLRKTSIRRTNFPWTYVGKWMVFEFKYYI